MMMVLMMMTKICQRGGFFHRYVKETPFIKYDGDSDDDDDDDEDI